MGQSAFPERSERKMLTVPFCPFTYWRGVNIPRRRLISADCVHNHLPTLSRLDRLLECFCAGVVIPVANYDQDPCDRFSFNSAGELARGEPNCVPQRGPTRGGQLQYGPRELSPVRREILH